MKNQVYYFCNEWHPCVNPVAQGCRYFFEEGIKMKRVKAACICQTLHFLLKEDVEHNYAVKLVQEEVAHYKATMDRNKTKYRILEEIHQEDGSIIVKVIKQYNACPVGDYLN